MLRKAPVHVVGLCFCFVFLAGCLSIPRRQTVSSDRIRIVPFGECLHASNGVVDIVISPQTGRLVGYGWSGERNFLWLDPDADTHAEHTGGWRNWGGVRNWVWPKQDWRRLTGREWPPAAEADGLPYQLKVEKNGRSLHLQSEVLPDYGFKIVNSIVFSKNGSTIAMATRFKRRGPGPVHTPWVAPWTITQIPLVNDGLFARLAYDEPAKTLYKLGESPPRFPIPRRYGRVLAFGRLSDAAGEAGLEADLLAVRFGDTLLVQKTLPFAKSALFRPGERAQVRLAADDAPTTAHLETSFTGPFTAASSARKNELVVVFSLLRLAREADERAVAAILQNL